AAICGERTLRVDHCAVIHRLPIHDSRKLAHRYFAAPALRSDGVTASTIAFFSCGVRSRCATLLGTTGGPLATSPLCVTVVPVAQLESAKPAASAAITLDTETCKARSLRACEVRMRLPS